MRLSEFGAAGFVDIEIRCLTELESLNAEKEAQPRRFFFPFPNAGFACEALPRSPFPA